MASEDIESYEDCGVELHPMMNAAPETPEDETSASAFPNDEKVTTQLLTETAVLDTGDIVNEIANTNSNQETDHSEPTKTHGDPHDSTQNSNLNNEPTIGHLPQEDGAFSSCILSQSSVDAQMEKMIDNIVELGGCQQFAQALENQDEVIDKDKQVEHIKGEIIGEQATNTDVPQKLDMIHSLPAEDVKESPQQQQTEVLDEKSPALLEDLQQLPDLKLTQGIISGGISPLSNMKIQENDEKSKMDEENPLSQSELKADNPINDEVDRKREVENEPSEHDEKKETEVVLEKPVEKIEEASLPEKPDVQIVTESSDQKTVEEVEKEPKPVLKETEDHEHLQKINTTPILESDVKLDDDKTKIRVNELSESKMETRRKISRRVKVLLEAKGKEEKTLVDKPYQEARKESNLVEVDQPKSSKIPPKGEEVQPKQVEIPSTETEDVAMEDSHTVEPEKAVRSVRSRASRKLVLTPEPPKTQPERRSSKRSHEPDHTPFDKSIQPVKKATLTARSASSRATISTSAPSTKPDHPVESLPLSVDGSQVYRCIPCKYSTTRLNNIVLHDKQYCKYKQQLVKDMSMAEAQKYHQQKHQQKHQRSNNKRSSR